MKNSNFKFYFTILKYSPIPENCYNVVEKKNVILIRTRLNTCLDYLHKKYPSRDNFKIEFMSATEL